MANIYTNMLEYRYYNQQQLSRYSYASPQNSPTVTLKIGEGSIFYTNISPVLPRGLGYSKGNTHSRLTYLTQRGFNIIIGRDKFIYNFNTVISSSYQAANATITKTGMFITIDMSKPSTSTLLYTVDHDAYASYNLIVIGGATFENSGGSASVSPNFMPLESSRYCF
jgi:hypothetical protein